MTKFFDINTRTLHVVDSYAGAVKLPQEVAMNAIPVNEYPLDAIRPITLRRLQASTFEQLFFSTDDNELHYGSFDINHNIGSESSTDLVEIANTIEYR